MCMRGIMIKSQEVLQGRALGWDPTRVLCREGQQRHSLDKDGPRRSTHLRGSVKGSICRVEVLVEL